MSVMSTAARMETASEPLLGVEGVKVHFPVDKGLWARLTGTQQTVRAVDGINLALRPGRTLGLVGESGCGKTTLGKAIMRLYEPTAGTIRFGGQEITHLPHSRLLGVRRRLQMVFQDPLSSLNRRQSVGQLLARPLQVHGIGNRREQAEIIDRTLEAVHIRPSYKNRYPHEFSGGQRQRIGIARALVLNPELIVLDEPVSALDVSIQAQIQNLFLELQEQRALSYLFIGHDLSVVKRVSDEVAVMYLGEIVEQGPPHVLSQPMHPYTRALISAVPGGGRNRERIVLQGDVPSPLNPPSGCKFRTRCPSYIGPVCSEIHPPLKEVAPGHAVRCHLYGAP